MHTLTASEVRANLYRLIDETTESHEPVIISGKRNSAVLISAEDWSAIQETLHLLAVPGMRESIKAGMAEPSQKVQKNLSGELDRCVCQTGIERCQKACCKRTQSPGARTARGTIQRSISESATL